MKTAPAALVFALLSITTSAIGAAPRSGGAGKASLSQPPSVAAGLYAGGFAPVGSVVDAAATEETEELAPDSVVPADPSLPPDAELVAPPAHASVDPDAEAPPQRLCPPKKNWYLCNDDLCFGMLWHQLFDVYAGEGVYAPEWKFRVGAVFLQRSRPKSVPLLSSNTGELLDADAFKFDTTAGPDISVFRRMTYGRSLELRYFGDLVWNAEVHGNPNGPGPTFAGDGAYRTRLNSTEANWRGDGTGPVQLLVGFRWIELHETLDFSHNGTHAYVDNDNHLYGAQFGATSAYFSKTHPFSIDGIVKAGIYGNAADTAGFIERPATPIFSATPRTSCVSFVGEANFAAAYYLTPRFALRAGYQLLWLEGVSLSSEQTGSGAFLARQVDATGGFFCHGAMTSLDMAF